VPAALPPDLAIAYVRELSADVLAVVVLAADGAHVAGPEALAAPARAFLDAAAGAPEVAERTPGGVAIAARTAVHAVVAVAGPLSLVGPTAQDVRAAAEALAAGAPGAPPDPPAAPADADAAPADRRSAAEALISAVHSAI
jgi:hypothetical protein